MRKFLLNPIFLTFQIDNPTWNEFPSFRLLCDGFRVPWPESVFFSLISRGRPQTNIIITQKLLNSWIPEKTSKLLVSSECCAGHTKYLRGPNVASGPRVRHPWSKRRKLLAASTRDCCAAFECKSAVTDDHDTMNRVSLSSMYVGKIVYFTRFIDIILLNNMRIKVGYELRNSKSSCSRNCQATIDFWFRVRRIQ